MVDGHLGGQLEHRILAQLRLGEQMPVHEVAGLVEQDELDAVQAQSDEKSGLYSSRQVPSPEATTAAVSTAVVGIW